MGLRPLFFSPPHPLRLRFPSPLPILLICGLSASQAGEVEIHPFWLQRGGVFTALILFFCPGTETAGAQEMPVPIEEQASLFASVVRFDRGMGARSEDGITVGVFYQPTHPPSVQAKDGFSQALETLGLQDPKGQAIRIVPIEMGPDLPSRLETAEIDLLYVTPIEGLDILSLSAATRRLGILSFSGIPEYAELGLAVALDTEGERHRILINLAAAEEERSNFRPGLLKMARIIQENP